MQICFSDVSIPQKDGRPPIEFNADGSKKYVELRIVNLQSKPDREAEYNVWEEIGIWQSTSGGM